MKQRAILVILLTATTTLAMAEDRVKIVAQSSKPMKEVCERISSLFHWRITYEDAPVLDMTEVVREKAPSGLSWLNMRAVPVSIVIPPMGNDSLAEYRRKVMDVATQAYAASGNRAAFCYTEDAEYIHVTPCAVAGPDGKIRPFESILKTPVTIPRGKYTLGQLVSAIIIQVGDRVGTTIALATVPNNIFASAMVMEEANNESASDVLMRAFDEINGPRYAAGISPMRLYWTLTYMADGPQYFLNVHGATAELDGAMVAQRSRTGEVPGQTTKASGDGRANSGFVNPPK